MGIGRRRINGVRLADQEEGGVFHGQGGPTSGPCCQPESGVGAGFDRKVLEPGRRKMLCAPAWVGRFWKPGCHVYYCPGLNTYDLEIRIDAPDTYTSF